MTTVFSATLLDQLVLDNIVTLNQTSLTNNFKLISECLSHFPTLDQRLHGLETSNRHLFDDFDKSKRKHDKEMQEIKNVLKTHLGVDIQEGRERKNSNSNINQGFNTLQSKAQTEKMNSEQLAKEMGMLELKIKEYVDTQLTKHKGVEDESKLRMTKLETEVEDFRGLLEKVLDPTEVDHKFLKVNQEIKELQNHLRLNHTNQKNQDTRYQESLSQVHLQIRGLSEGIQLLNNFVSNSNDKWKLKADCADLFKLESMLLGMMETSVNQVVKKAADKQQTKKALVFLEKRINKVISLMTGQSNQAQKDAMIATKSWKCVSCTKDLGDYEGKLDQYKPWAVFPTKVITKDKYHGFGVGFQDVVEKVVEKKGVDPTFDTYGRMTTPHNLSREVNVGSNKTSVTPSGKMRSTSQSNSQAKIRSTPLNQYQNTIMSNPSPSVDSLQTGYMHSYGCGHQSEVNLVEEYRRKYKGIKDISMTGPKD